jgi:hypothetical protein
MKKLIVILQFFSRVFFWILGLFLPIEKVLKIPHGCDTLNIFAPYSFGGVPKKDFLRLYKESKTRKITSNEYTQVEYGSLRPDKEQVAEKYKRSHCIKKWFGDVFLSGHP